MATAPEAAVTVTLDTAVLAWLVVDVAVIVTLVAPAGAVNVVVAPAGAQLQSTPLFAESLETVAEIDAVPLAIRVFGGAWVMATLTPPEGCEVVPDPTAPQPDRPMAKSNRVTPANTSNSNVRVARTFSTISS
jgi:hypothetical protein